MPGRAPDWALLAVGFGFIGFALAGISGIALSYLMDCYRDIIGDALVGVIFMRNIFVIVLFALTPWVEVQFLVLQYQESQYTQLKRGEPRMEQTAA
ncbi:hypothetical protein NUU61_009309 [Penicillium alfredii]|uniref:Uncharacterized protein n=1 Tax=Penicillium alfredii TaxID=1506179 RepID=A0A9W9EN08_9EURO|nr:uncharacterized protein NUU61_009309 [Penicillium alfredii]KAJ5084730.1 hypothetical protein NUU61_009309 [Penicillium alfredii]